MTETRCLSWNQQHDKQLQGPQPSPRNLGAGVMAVTYGVSMPRITISPSDLSPSNTLDLAQPVSNQSVNGV